MNRLYLMKGELNHFPLIFDTSTETLPVLLVNTGLRFWHIPVSPYVESAIKYGLKFHPEKDHFKVLKIKFKKTLNYTSNQSLRTLFFIKQASG